MAKREETLQKYVSDMLAVNQHILEALERQARDEHVRGYPEAAQLVSGVETLLKGYNTQLEAHLRMLGGEPTAPVKKAATAVLGIAAGLIDKVRPDKVTEALRDDYTALNLAAMSYSLLHTTGMALKNTATADLALAHLTGLAPMIMRINQVIPSVVARELVDEAENVDTSVGPEAARHIEEAWRNRPH